jgi:hypothetical protein
VVSGGQIGNHKSAAVLILFPHGKSGCAAADRAASITTIEAVGHCFACCTSTRFVTTRICASRALNLPYRLPDCRCRPTCSFIAGSSLFNHEQCVGINQQARLLRLLGLAQLRCSGLVAAHRTAGPCLSSLASWRSFNSWCVTCASLYGVFVLLFV